MSAKLIVNCPDVARFERDFETTPEMVAFVSGLKDGVCQSDYYDFTTEILQKSKPNARALREAVLSGYDEDLPHREAQSLPEAEGMPHVVYIAFGDGVQEMNKDIKTAISTRNPVPTPQECFCHTVVIGFETPQEKEAYLEGIVQGMNYVSQNEFEIVTQDRLEHAFSG